MKISSVMSRDVQLIKPDDTIRSAAALMAVATSLGKLLRRATPLLQATRTVV
jgi:CBS domain-containing protein